MVGFAGGLAQGIGSGAAISQNRRSQALDLARFKLAGQQLQADERRALLTSHRDQVANFQALVKAGVGSGKLNAQQLPPGISRSMEMLIENAAALGVEGQTQLQLQSILETTAAPAEVATAETEAALAQAEVLGLGDEAARAAVTRKLGLTGEDGDAFFRALNELERLREDVAAGRRQADDPRIGAVQERVNALLEPQAGLTLVIGDDGRIRGLTTGPAGEAQGLFSELPTTDQLGEFERLSALESNVTLVDSLLTSLQEDPTRFGITGSLRRGGQAAVGVAADLGEVIKNATGIDINDAARASAELIKGSEIEGELAGFFDPDLSDIELLENTLAFELARLRIQRAGGDIRALTQAFKDAKDDVQLTGLTTSRDVRERLLNIRGQFVEEIQTLSTGLRGQGVEIPEPPAPPLETLQNDRDELDRQIDEILGITR